MRSFNDPVSRALDSVNDQDSYRGANYDELYPAATSSALEAADLQDYHEQVHEPDQRRNQFSPNPGFINTGLPIDYSQHVSQRSTYPSSSYSLKNGDYLSKNNNYHNHNKSETLVLKTETFNLKKDVYPEKELDYSTKDGSYTPKDEDFSLRGGLFSNKEDARMQIKTQENYFRYVTSQLHEYYNRRHTGPQEYNRRQTVGQEYDRRPTNGQDYDRDPSRSTDLFNPECGREDVYPGPRSLAQGFGYRGDQS